MDVLKQYPQYAPVAKYIRSEHLERVIAIAETLAKWIVECVKALEAPPAPAPIIIDSRRSVRRDLARAARFSIQ
jgi:hypothetical protein